MDGLRARYVILYTVIGSMSHPNWGCVMIYSCRVLAFVLLLTLTAVSKSDARSRALPDVSIDANVEVVGEIVRGHPISLRVTAIPRPEFDTCETVLVDLHVARNMPQPSPTEQQVDRQSSGRIDVEFEVNFLPELYLAYSVSFKFCDRYLNFYEFFIVDYVDSVVVTDVPDIGFRSGTSVPATLERRRLEQQLKQLESRFLSPDTLGPSFRIDDIGQHNDEVRRQIDSIRTLMGLGPIFATTLETSLSDSSQSSVRQAMFLLNPEEVDAVRSRVDSLVSYAPHHYWAYVSKTATASAKQRVDELLEWFEEYVRTRHLQKKDVESNRKKPETPEIEFGDCVRGTSYSILSLVV